MARVYAALERVFFGHALARRRNCFLGDARLAQAERILILGDGDGRFTADLLGRYATATVTVVDSSAGMLAELARRVRLRAPNAKLELHCADARAWGPALASYDLVATHFFFDCLSTPEVAALVAKIAASLAPGASWIVSDFAVPKHWLWAFLTKPVLRGLYLAQSALTGSKVRRLPDHASALRGAGFALNESKTGLGGSLRSELWQRGSGNASAL